MNVVVVSNRVARAKPDEPLAGGLAAALLPMVRDSGAIWVGSSGQETATTQTHDSFAKIEALGSGALATVDMPAQHYRGYYEGFANSALWPALHSRPDLIHVTTEDYESYREINAFMGRALQRFNSPEAVFWVQDYHFLTLGAELRQQGIERPLGFFLHTPWADRRTMSAVPHCNDLAEAMLAYDLIGFQTVEDRQNFEDFLRTELSLNIVDGTVASHWGLTQLATFPIGIDVDDFAARASKSVTRPEVTRLRESLHGAKLVLGVDRLDYSKGLANRVRAFDRMLEIEPGLKRHVSLLQVAVPSRGNIKAYRELKSELAGLVGEVNGRHGEVDWSPIRYLNKGFSQLTLAGFYRVAGVGLVTPLHDGMNLVAKEYVAAQNPLDPGVLVLSSFAGAAKELDAALLINPHDIDGMARQIAVALKMSIEERRERWHAMVRKLKVASVQAWFAHFLHVLSDVRRTPLQAATRPIVLELASRRAANNR
ncbi:MAG TPA: trehalose-6-phosphate synthase [Xanthobacteraceae bacterium]|jgi:trehalose 6-phosphate synthase|nr:trehalose-6-phosphate synthase [Xanthobacteraceae bacterium]